MPIIPIIRSGGPKPSGKITITENGTGIDVAQYAEADVAVPSSDPILGEITVKTYTSGYYVDIYGIINIIDGKVKSAGRASVGSIGSVLNIGDTDMAPAAYIVAKPHNSSEQISSVTGNSGGTAKSVAGIGWVIPVKSGDTVVIDVTESN